MNENVVLVQETSGGPIVGSVKLSWAGLIGGIVVAVGVWLLLTVLGLAIGLTVLDLDTTDGSPMMSTLKSAGIGTGIYSAIITIIALFCGGFVAARASGTLTRPAAAIHGAVLWALATLLTIMFIGGVIGSVLRGAATTAGVAAQISMSPRASMRAHQAFGTTPPAPPPSAPTMDINENELIGPINDRLRKEGKAPLTPMQLHGIVQSQATMAFVEGRMDKEGLATSMANSSPGLSQSDARDLANRIESQVNRAPSGAGGGGAAALNLPQVTPPSSEEVKKGAMSAADTIGKAMWWVFLGMLLGLASAVLGSLLGLSRRQRLAARTLFERPTTATMFPNAAVPVAAGPSPVIHATEIRPVHP